MRLHPKGKTGDIAALCKCREICLLLCTREAAAKLHVSVNVLKCRRRASKQSVNYCSYKQRKMESIYSFIFSVVDRQWWGSKKATPMNFPWAIALRNNPNSTDVFNTENIVILCGGWYIQKRAVYKCVWHHIILRSQQGIDCGTPNIRIFHYFTLISQCIPITDLLKTVGIIRLLRTIRKISTKSDASRENICSPTKCLMHPWQKHAEPLLESNFSRWLGLGRTNSYKIHSGGWREKSGEKARWV